MIIIPQHWAVRLKHIERNRMHLADAKKTHIGMPFFFSLECALDVMGSSQRKSGLNMQAATRDIHTRTGRLAKRVSHAT